MTEQEQKEFDNLLDWLREINRDMNVYPDHFTSIELYRDGELNVDSCKKKFVISYKMARDHK